MLKTLYFLVAVFTLEDGRMATMDAMMTFEDERQCMATAMHRMSFVSDRVYLCKPHRAL